MLNLPADFDGYAGEVESKGWFSLAQLRVAGKTYQMNFYDPVRLAQDIEASLATDQFFFEPNLVVVKSVTRGEMEQAAAYLERSVLLESFVAT
jgi:hypothetical protein